MRTRFRLLALACGLSLFPQTAHSQNASEPVGAPIEQRRLQIIVDGAEQPDGAGEAGPSAVAAAVTAQTLEPPPGVEPPPADLAPSSFGQSGRVQPVPVRETEPRPPPAEWIEDALRVPMAPGEGWRIQVGAFSDSARAESAIASLETIAAGPGADPIRLVVPAGGVYRAQMSGFVDRAAADGACARIAAAGQACFVVAPE